MRDRPCDGGRNEGQAPHGHTLGRAPARGQTLKIWGQTPQTLSGDRTALGQYRDRPRMAASPSGRGPGLRAVPPPAPCHDARIVFARRPPRGAAAGKLPGTVAARQGGKKRNPVRKNLTGFWK